MAGPLQREVEAPRTVTRWGPLLVLSSGAMITIMSIMMLTAQPRLTACGGPRTAPAPRLGGDASLGAPGSIAPDREPEICGQRVWRASPDGRAEQFEDCVTPVRR